MVKTLQSGMRRLNAGKHRQANPDSESFLFAPWRHCDCSLSQCNIDARRIAPSIYQTLENNQTWVSGMFGDGPDRYRGYFCWDWAYGFLDAFALAVGSSSCFTAIIERSVGPTIGKLSSIHYFLRISSICDSSESVFIDDGFANNSFIHDDPPMSGRS